MHPLLGIGSLVGVVLVGVLLLSSLRRVRSWSRRRDLEFILLVMPMVSLALSVAGLRFGAGSLCFLGPLPVDYRVNIALALFMGLMAVAGLAGGVLRLVLLQRTFAARGQAAQPWLAAEITRLAGPLGISQPAVRIVVHDRPLALTYGTRRPTLLLSTWMLAQLDKQELSAVLAHELGHVVQRDCAMVWLATVLRDAFWYLPTSRIAYRQLQQDKEPACDDFANDITDRPLALASALAKVWRHAALAPAVGMAQSLTGVDTSIETRITRLLVDATPGVASIRHHRRTLAAGGVALAALVTLAVTNAVVLLAPMGCGSMAPLGKLL
ncbi:MAG TPA: M56 family metallopeptidase [Dehalococcoidia bacterium]|jgi:Zn-dependent protease with chaperone function